MLELEGPPQVPSAGPPRSPPVTLLPAQTRVLGGPPMEFRSHRGVGGNFTLQSIHALSPALLCHTKQCPAPQLSNCICMNWQLYLYELAIVFV